MDTFLKPPHLLSFTITILLISISHAQQLNEQFSQCNLPFNCGNITNLPYPFWGDGRTQVCGLQGFELQCPNDHAQYPKVNISSHEFQVLDIQENNSLMRIVRTDMLNVCNFENLTNITLDHTLFDYVDVSDYMVSLLFECSQVFQRILARFLFPCRGQKGYNYYLEDRVLRSVPELPACARAVRIPMARTEFDKAAYKLVEFKDALSEGFYVQYNQQYQDDCNECKKSDGICGSSRNGRQFSCLCREGPHSRVCQNNQVAASDRKKKLMIIVGVSAGVGGILIFSIVLFIFVFLKRRKKYTSFLSSRDISSELSKPGIKEESYKGLHVFSYEALEKATNNFDPSKELGDGGFGTVYYGKLEDGRAVAVKRLYENHNKRVVEQFMNEVEILALLCHQNLVTLYGSTSRDSRQLLLVYEYIANGTVADHLYGEFSKNSALRWTTRLKIAIETAGALVYLHASDVIHRDVKSNNILLDSNFCVKVADFGLSRLVPIDVTHVSTLPQGTPGYLDPEYHQLCQLTEKSDVYSFGVVLIELISSKPPVDMTRPPNEVSLANFAIKKISEKQMDELVDPNLGYGSDNKVKRMINAVAELALQCLQNGRDLRPTMAEVLDALKRVQREVQVEEGKENGHANNSSVLLKGEMPRSPNQDAGRLTNASTAPDIGR